MKEIDDHQQECDLSIRAVNDAMYVLNGKWKIPIAVSLCHYETRRFSDLLINVKGISNRMLSKELREMEMNKLVKRTIMDSQPKLFSMS